MKKILVIAPHADDETLGCGGTLLRHKAEGDQIHWLLVTNLFPEVSKHVSKLYPFDSTTDLKHPTTKLDQIPMAELVGGIGKVVQDISPQIIYVPFRGDVHSDHKITFDAAIACTKWFRHPSIQKVLSYETLSETDFGLDPDSAGFRPNVFIDIKDHIDRKLKILSAYSNELGEFPFPRSIEAVRALSKVRGASSGFDAAEAFLLLRERV
jgi:LmbE family N-acetylglucosaminyl deacetylase